MGRGGQWTGFVRARMGWRGEVSTVASRGGRRAGGFPRRPSRPRRGCWWWVWRTDASSVFLSFLGSRVAGRGGDLGRASGDAQVDESAVQGLALLDHVVLLEELLEGETLLVEHELRVGRRAGWKEKSVRWVRGGTRTESATTNRGRAGGRRGRRGPAERGRDASTATRDPARRASRRDPGRRDAPAATPPRGSRRWRQRRENVKNDRGRGARHARRARQIAARVRASGRAPRQGKSAPVPETSRTSYHARANGRLSGRESLCQPRPREPRRVAVVSSPLHTTSRACIVEHSRLPRSKSIGTRDREPARFIATFAFNGHFQTKFWRGEARRKRSRLARAFVVAPAPLPRPSSSLIFSHRRSPILSPY